MSMVIQMPPGSLPGMMNLASAPTIRPMRAVQSRCSIAVPPCWFSGAAGYVSIDGERILLTLSRCNKLIQRNWRIFSWPRLVAISYFAAGHYAPHTLDGMSLLAHELTDVVQQTRELSPLN